MRIGLAGGHLGLDAFPHRSAEVVLHPLRRRMEVVERQLRMAAEPRLPQPVRADDRLSLAGRRRREPQAVGRHLDTPGEPQPHRGQLLKQRVGLR